MNGNASATIVLMAMISVFPAPDAMASAQEPSGSVTLEEALSLFGQKSPELHLARSRLREALGRIRQGRALPNPRMAVTHEALGDYSESYLNLTQQVDFLWETANRSARADGLSSKARAQFLADSARLALDVKRAYVEAWQRRETLAAYRKADEVIAELLVSAEARFSEGDLAGYDLRRLRLEHVQFGRRTAAEELDLGDAERRLGSFLVDSNDYRRFSPEDLGMGGISSAVEGDLVAQALRSRPEILAAESLVNALAAETGLAKASGLRGTSVTGGVKRQADGIEGLFFGLRVIARQVSLASARLQTAQRQQELLGPSGIQEAQELLAIARLSFAEGEMRVVDLLDASEAFVEARLMDSRVRRELWDAYFELEQAVGGFSTETDNGVRER